MQENVLSLKKVDVVLNEAIILDYYVSALWWAGKEQKFTKEQISAFYAVINTLLNNIRGTDKQSLVESSFGHWHIKSLSEMSEMLFSFCLLSFLVPTISCW